MWVDRSVSVATVLLLLITTTTQQPTECSDVVFGTTNGLSVQLPDVPLSAGDSDFSVRVPVNTCSQFSGQVGTRIEVCDFDLKPFLQASSGFTFYVRRYSDLKHVAVLHTTVFCFPVAGPVTPSIPVNPAPPVVVPDSQPSRIDKTFR